MRTLAMALLLRPALQALSTEAFSLPHRNKNGPSRTVSVQQGRSGGSLAADEKAALEEKKSMGGLC